MADETGIVYSLTVESRPPSVFASLDFRAYLGAWFMWKKQVHAGYSHRLFARRAGQRSPSLLKAVIDGKRNLTVATCEAFSRALSHSESEAAFFAALVLVAAAVLGLATVLPAWAAALIVGGVLLLLTGIIAGIGIAQLKRGLPPTPSDTIDSIGDDIRVLRGEGKAAS